MSLVAGAVSIDLESSALKFLQAFDLASKKIDDFGNTSDKTSTKTGSSFLNLSNIISSAVGNTIANAFSMATSSATNFFKSQLDSVANLESTRMAFNGLIGDTKKAGEIMSQVVKEAAKTPFEIPELAESAKMLAAFGVEADDIIPSLMRVGDVAAGLDVPIKDMAYLVGTIQSQGKAMTADLNQFANRGVPIWIQLAKVTGKSEEALRKMAEKGQISSKLINKAFESMSGKGGAFFEMMKKKSNTYTGVMSTLNDTIGAVGRKLLGLTDNGEIVTGGVFEMLKNNLLSLTEFLTSPSGTTFITSISENIKKAIAFVGKLKEAFEVIFKLVTTGDIDFKKDGIFGQYEDGAVYGFFFSVHDILKKTYDIISKVDWKEFSDTMYRLAPLLIGLGVGFASFSIISSVTAGFTALTGALTLASGGAGLFAGAMVILASPIALIAVGIGLLVAAGLYLWHNWDFITQSIGEAWLLVVAVFNSTLKVVGDFFTKSFNQIKDTIFGVFKSIEAWLFVSFSKWVERSYFVIGFVLGSIANLFINIVKVMYTAFTFFGDGLTAFFLALPGIVYTVLWNIGRFFVEGFNWLFKVTGDFFNWIGNWFRQIPQMALNAITGAIIWFLELKNALLRINLWQVGQNIIDGLLGGLRSSWKNVTGWLNSAAKGFTDGFKNAMGIRSPSRVMAELGINVSQGLAVGLQANEPNLQKVALDSLAVSNAVQPIDQSVSNATTSQSSSIIFNISGVMPSQQDMDNFFKRAKQSAKNQGYQIA